MKAKEIVSPDGIETLRLADRPIPEPGPRKVQVRINASSINYRDLGTISDPGPSGIPYPTTPNSDVAGEVTAVVDRVTRFKVGDWVMGTFMQNWVDGPMTPTTVVSALGGSVDGRLTAYAVLDEDGLVLTPSHLSDTEAVTLPCAAVTAWHSLVEVGGPGTMERSITAVIDRSMVPGPPTSTRLCHAVTAAQGSVTASVSLRWDGVKTKPSSSKTAYAVNRPSTDPPSALTTVVGVIGPSTQFCIKVPMTQSPTLKRVTRSTTAVTSPATSELGVVG